MSHARSYTPPVNAQRPIMSSDLSSAILFQLKDALPRIEAELSKLKDSIPRIETELKHLRNLAEATRHDVDSLKTWKTLVLGGAAVLGLMLGVYRATAASVHVTFGESPPAVRSEHQPLEPQR